mmetsp:Transcript_90158/g.254265  ORF Transcript_90158/g.254265 Transcript_90158/m.254265 type:complete len:237 (-) Transcript_90158:322-1032(-)
MQGGCETPEPQRQPRHQCEQLHGETHEGEDLVVGLEARGEDRRGQHRRVQRAGATRQRGAPLKDQACVGVVRRQNTRRGISSARFERLVDGRSPVVVEQHVQRQQPQRHCYDGVVAPAARQGPQRWGQQPEWNGHQHAAPGVAAHSGESTGRGSVRVATAAQRRRLEPQARRAEAGAAGEKQCREAEQKLLPPRSGLHAEEDTRKDGDDAELLHHHHGVSAHRRILIPLHIRVKHQ